MRDSLPKKAEPYRNGGAAGDGTTIRSIQPMNQPNPNHNSSPGASGPSVVSGHTRARERERRDPWISPTPGLAIMAFKVQRGRGEAPRFHACTRPPHYCPRPVSLSASHVRQRGKHRPSPSPGAPDRPSYLLPRASLSVRRRSENLLPYSGLAECKSPKPNFNFLFL